MAAFTNKPVYFAAGGMDLAKTLFCGQSFAWKKEENNTFIGVAGTHAVRAWQVEDTLFFTKPDNMPLQDDDISFWRYYFSLDTDYAMLENQFSQNEKLAACVACAAGIRVLRQPFFDTLLSFILSQNNHLLRIAGIAARLRENFGLRLVKDIYAFPSPETLATLATEDLAPLRAGFRAKYLLDAARRVASGEVSENKLCLLPDEEARQLLMHIHGVGQKVADCVLLYSLGRTRVVPMDVWMKRAMATTFPAGMPAAAHGNEGIAQQYIFCWAKEHLR